jgi:hypothetical protein
MKKLLYLGLSLDREDPKVRVFGNPAGLRYLANILHLMADDAQDNLTDREPAEFSQIRASQDAAFIEGSLSLTVGRLDHKDDGSTEWFTDVVCGDNSPNSHLKDILAEALKKKQYPAG